MLEMLKVSNQDYKLAQFYFQTRETLKNSPPKMDLVSIYADDHAELTLKVIAAMLSQAKREAFLKEHAEKKKQLHKAIQRKKNKAPVVTSQFLREHGILPGQKMGRLLALAETLAVESGSENPHQILEWLKKDPLWSSELS